MTSLPIRRIDGPARSAVADAVETALLASLATINAQSRNESIVLAVHDGEGRLVGGLTAATSYGWLLVKTLWVDAAYRGAGLGRRLMQHAEEEGRKIGCHAVWLDTSNPEAHAVYLKLGYADFGVLANASGQHPESHRRWFMRKSL